MNDPRQFCLNGYFFVLVLCLSHFHVAFSASCESEQTTLQDCVTSLDSSVFQVDEFSSDASTSTFDYDLYVELLEEECPNELDALRTCSDDSGEKGLGLCRVLFLPLWTACALSLLFICGSCDLQLKDTDCESFEINSCHRSQCCPYCSDVLEAGYIQCVKDEGACDEPKWFDCEPERSTGQKIGIGIAIALACVVVLGGIVLLAVYLRDKKMKEKQEEEAKKRDDTPQHHTVVVANQGNEDAGQQAVTNDE